MDKLEFSDFYGSLFWALIGLLLILFRSKLPKLQFRPKFLSGWVSVGVITVLAGAIRALNVYADTLE